jgi:hypothetical protein
VIVLNIVLLNLFLALFFESFENPTKESDTEDQEISGLFKFQEKFFAFLRKILMFMPAALEKRF